MKTIIPGFFCLLLIIGGGWTQGADKPWVSFDRYHSPEEIGQLIGKAASAHPRTVRRHEIAVSFGGIPVQLLEIGMETGSKEKRNPAVFVAANMEGTNPLASEAALFLIESLLKNEKLLQNRTWYILPMGNPDASSRYFQKPLQVDGRNGKPRNDDMDDQTDEDPGEDLNGDGLLTQMRVKDPEGEWLPLAGEPRLMKKADPAKGEKGIYKLYSEGIDNDRDGRFNEDGKGGVNIGLNFPHLFKFFTADSGDWAGSEAESFGLFRFIYAHPEIAMAITFGDANFCMIAPRGGRRGEADLTRIKIPQQFASMFGADSEKNYTIDEIKEMVQPMLPPGMEVTEAMIASFLGLGAVVNPLPADIEYYNKISEEYKEFLKKNKLEEKRLESPDAKDGSFDLWAYYQLGLPSFSLDFWTLPEPKKPESKDTGLNVEKLEAMSNDEFIALGPEKIGEFMKTAGAPPGFKAEMVIDMVKTGKMTTKKMAEMMKQMKPKSAGADDEGTPAEKALLQYSDKDLGGHGFMAWKPFQHPQLGEAEIGGTVPFSDRAPKPELIDGLLKAQVPWVFTLAEKSAALKIEKTQVIPLGGNLYRLKLWVANTGKLPYPTAMGSRNGRIKPIQVKLSGKGFKLVEGLNRMSIREIGAGQTRMVSWIIQAEVATQVRIEVASPMIGKVDQVISLGGAQ